MVILILHYLLQADRSNSLSLFSLSFCTLNIAFTAAAATAAAVRQLTVGSSSQPPHSLGRLPSVQQHTDVPVLLALQPPQCCPPLAEESLQSKTAKSVQPIDDDEDGDDDDDQRT